MLYLIQIAILFTTLAFGQELSVQEKTLDGVYYLKKEVTLPTTGDLLGQITKLIADTTKSLKGDIKKMGLKETSSNFNYFVDENPVHGIALTVEATEQDAKKWGDKLQYRKPGKFLILVCKSNCEKYLMRTQGLAKLKQEAVRLKKTFADSTYYLMSSDGQNLKDRKTFLLRSIN